MKESDLDDVLVEVARVIAFDGIFNVVQAIYQALEKCYGALGGCRSPSPTWPTGCLQILYRIDPAGPQEWEEHVKGLNLEALNRHQNRDGASVIPKNH